MMEVSEEAFLDCSEPNPDGTYDYRYEGTYTVFLFDEGRSLRARRYVDTPAEAALFFGPGGPDEDDEETRSAVEWLRHAGVTTVKVLGGQLGAYRTIWHQSSDEP